MATDEEEARVVLSVPTEADVISGAADELIEVVPASAAVLVVASSEEKLMV